MTINLLYIFSSVLMIYPSACVGADCTDQELLGCIPENVQGLIEPQPDGSLNVSKENTATFFNGICFSVHNIKRCVKTFKFMCADFNSSLDLSLVDTLDDSCAQFFSSGRSNGGNSDGGDMGGDSPDVGTSTPPPDNKGTSGDHVSCNDDKLFACVPENLRYLINLDTGETTGPDLMKGICPLYGDVHGCAQAFNVSCPAYDMSSTIGMFFGSLRDDCEVFISNGGLNQLTTDGSMFWDPTLKPPGDDASANGDAPSIGAGGVACTDDKLLQCVPVYGRGFVDTAADGTMILQPENEDDFMRVVCYTSGNLNRCVKMHKYTCPDHDVSLILGGLLADIINRCDVFIKEGGMNYDNGADDGGNDDNGDDNDGNYNDYFYGDGFYDGGFYDNGNQGDGNQGNGQDTDFGYDSGSCAMTGPLALSLFLVLCLFFK